MPSRNTLDIRWLTSDPDALVARLRAFGFEIESGRILAFPSATIGIDVATRPARQLEVDDGPPSLPAPERPHPNGIVDVHAVGWATVDRERFTAGLAPEATEALPRDPHLGAFVLGRGPARPYVLVLEPDTEGRLASSLARFGEGPAAIYLRAGAGGLAAFVAEAGRRESAVSSVLAGPLGPSVILSGGPVWGPHIVIVEADRPP